MTEHTKEPWDVCDDATGADAALVYSIADATFPPVFRALPADAAQAAQLHENVRRAAACVNACAGIPTEALEAGALAKVLSEASDCASPDVYSPNPLQALRAALATLRTDTNKPT